ncbi:hypothetical protein GQ44DRAFT_778982 [Phaeosphaeriaceae sp. PMI808]|nr:hypothetical protein GQ44DRAFT_778982 [Phaeosphaeriaceae sp. PMI808]
MSLKHASWTHGLSVELENGSWTAFRQGFYSTVRPSSESTFGWVHFAIPTPVIVEGNRLHAVKAWIRYATGSGAKITRFHVYDGEKKIANFDGLNLSGALRNESRDVPGRPSVLWGTGISLGVQFSGNGPNDYIQFISAGIDFDN